MQHSLLHIKFPRQNILSRFAVPFTTNILSSLAVVSNNRIKIGVGLSPREEGFQAPQIPWAKRGKRMDEMIQTINDSNN